MEQEKRKSVRIKPQLVIRCSRDGMVWDMPILKDFSLAGMRIVTEKTLEKDLILQVRLSIPFDPANVLEFSGRVVDCKSFDGAISNAYVARIEFLDFKEDQKVLLQKYVEWFLKKK